MHSIFSNVEASTISKFTGLYAHKFYISNSFEGAISEYKGIMQGYDYEDFPDEIMEAPLFEPFFTRRLKMVSRSDGFMLYGKLGVNFFSTSEWLYPNMKIRLRLIRARPNFYMISENTNVSLGFVIVHFTLVVLLSRMIITRNEWTCLLTVLWSSTIWKLLQRLSSFLPDKTSSFKKSFSTMLQFVGLLSRHTNSAFTGSYTENPFWYQQFDLRQIRILSGGQPIVDFDAADNCRLYVITMKAMNFSRWYPLNSNW